MLKRTFNAVSSTGVMVSFEWNDVVSVHFDPRAKNTPDHPSLIIVFGSHPTEVFAQQMCFCGQGAIDLMIAFGALLKRDGLSPTHGEGWGEE